MDLQPYVDGVRHELGVAAAAGGRDVAQPVAWLRGRDPQFTVSPAVHDEPEPVAAVPEADDDGGTWRVTLRLPESLRSPVDAAARADGLSVNAWLLRAVASTLGGKRHARANTDKHFSGWVR